MLSQSPGRPLGGSDISIFIKHMFQTDYPGIAHILILRLPKPLTDT
jgi:hypothetical protein